MADVFLSYARVDRVHAEAILARLQALGLSVFFDIEDGVRTGDAFPQVIANEVMDAKCVVACWSPEALSRPWCRRECFLALERGTLVPVAVGPVTATDLREFVDISYEDLTDFAGQEKHFGWSQALRGIAQSFERWTERNASHPECEASLTFAGQLRLASLKMRPDNSDAAPKAASARTELWERLKTTNDVGRLLRFAESFPNSVESFHARDLAAAWTAYKEIALTARKPGEKSEVEGLEQYWPWLHERLAAGRLAIEIDDNSELSKLVARSAIELRKEMIDEAIAGITSVTSYNDQKAWRLKRFVADWPNHPEIEEMLKYISVIEKMQAEQEPVLEPLRRRSSMLNRGLVAHIDASYRRHEEEDEEESEEENSRRDEWTDIDLEGDPADEVELLDNLPDVKEASKLEMFHIAERALTQFREEQHRLAHKAAIAASTEYASFPEENADAQAPNVIAAAEASTNERWSHVAWVIGALLIIALPIAIYWASLFFPK